jgi:DNA-binding response OmpR family regulator
MIEIRTAPTATPHLIALQPAVSPPEAEVGDDGLTIGRGTQCHIVVPSPVVSRMHAQIKRAGARFQLCDLGSVNGTYVNGNRVHDTYLLNNYDLIGLGEANAQLTFVDPDATRATAARLTYDERSMRFSVGTTLLELTPNQFRLLRFLFQNRGNVCTREQCAEAVWGPTFAPGMDATTLDRLISTLRSTLRRGAAEANLIVTRPGLGYQLADAA